MQVENGVVRLSPSDVTEFLGCTHATALSLRAARGEIERPELGPEARLIIDKGLQHERAHLERLRASGLTVAEIDASLGLEAAAADTRRALAGGVDVVYQAVLGGGRWRGVADFLERRPDGSYEPVDTKFARTAKPAYVLQLYFYAACLDPLPARMHVLLGSGELRSFRPRDFAAFARRVQARLEAFVDAPPPTEALPCEQCGRCPFSPLCSAHWDATDHLCRVAGCGRREIAALTAVGIGTLTALATAAEPPPDPTALHGFERLRRQARLQLARRSTGALVHEVLEPRVGHGLALLPDPSPGDLFLDLEGNPFWDERGSLEYLWGILGPAGYTAIWGHDHDGERRALERFVDLVLERRAADPGLHVYHYAPYEVTALRRIAERYGTREHEVARLVRDGALVDLYRVVTGGLQASVPRYGLKELEAFLPLERRAAIRDGATSIVEHERYVETGDPSILEEIERYNEEDCRATLELRDWLLDRRAESLARFGPFPAPAQPPPADAGEDGAEEVRLHDALVATGDPALVLLGQLVERQPREDRPLWWAIVQVEANRLAVRLHDPPPPAEPPADGEPAERPGPGPLKLALARVGRSLLAGDGRYPVAASILRGDATGHEVVHAPPGTGEAEACGRRAAGIALAGGRLAVVAPSHHALHRVLDALDAEIAGRGVAPGGRRHGAGDATPLMDADADERLDAVIVAAAGRVALGDALGVAAAARDAVIAGDPQGLGPGAVSVLGHLLGDAETLPAGRAVFLDRTDRLHPRLCAWVSEEYYGGRLVSVAACEATALPAGLRFVPVDHAGCRSDSPAEAERVAREVERLLAAGVPAAKILVLTPYTAHADLLATVLPEGVEATVVDHAEGLEADVVVYSLAASSTEEASRGLDWVLSRARLLTAVTTARRLAIVVASPRLLDASPRSVEAMRRLSALCRLVEVASAQAACDDRPASQDQS